MGKEFYDNFPVARQVFEEASDALSMRIDRLCFTGPESDLKKTENTQPAVLATSVAALKALESETGARPVVTAGHSLGEYSALVCANALDLDVAVKLVRNRGRFMQEAAPEGAGAMAAVIGLEDAAVEELVEEVSTSTGRVVVTANYNSPGQVVISGHADAVEAVADRAKDRGAKKVVFLNVSAPFHSPLMKPAAERLAERLAEASFSEANVPVISNVDACTYKESEKARELLEQQVCAPVMWTQSMSKLREYDVELAIEIGPGKVLAGLLRKIDKDIQCIPVGDIEGLKQAATSGI